MKKTIYVIILLFFIQGIVHNMGHPITPSFVRSLGIADYMFGIYFSAMSLGLMFGAPLWGILGDRGNKKFYIIFGLMFYTIGQLFFGYSGNATLMVIARLFSGFGVVSATTLFTARLIEVTSPKDRAKYFAYVAASSTLGSSIGYWFGGFITTHPLMIQLLGTDDFRRIFLYQPILNMVYILMIALLLDEVRVKKTSTRQPSILQGFKEIAHIDKSLFLFMLSMTFMTIGATNLSKFIDIYFFDLNYTPQDLGTFVMATGIVSLLASIFIVPFAARIKKQLIFIGLMHIAAAFIVFWVFRSNQFMLAIYTVYMIYVIFRTIYVPLEQSYIATYAKEGQYGGMMGLRQSFVSIGMVIGPIVGGLLYNIAPIVQFDFNAYMFLLGVALLFISYTLKPKRGEQNGV
jgi:DHA1 family multidrug resistance protein-like MFS transporter